MFTLVNEQNQRMNLTLNEHFYLLDFGGLTQINTDISSDVVNIVDGDVVTFMHSQPRDIVLNLALNGNIELSKRHILNIIKSRQKIKIEWTQEARMLELYGYVSSIDLPRFDTLPPIMTVNIHCEDPYWQDTVVQTTEISIVNPLHYFTKNPKDMLFFDEDGIVFGEIGTSKVREITNLGDTNVGFDIEINAKGEVTNPVVLNDKGDFLGFGNEIKPVTMSSGDTLTACTIPGKKSAKLNGISLFDRILPYSTWINLTPGRNVISINSDEGNANNLNFSIKFRQKFV